MNLMSPSGLFVSLMASLASLAIGRVEGLERIVGYILPENYAMQHICRKLGFTLRYDRFEDAMEHRSNCEVRVDSWPIAWLAVLLGEKPTVL
jgi:RimJ/RimL family protein N-acetyltransferase